MIQDAAFFAAVIPAARATCKTSPLGTVFSATRFIVSKLAVKIPSAFAYLNVLNFGLTSIILYPLTLKLFIFLHFVEHINDQKITFSTDLTISEKMF
jgi:hypothetical protein